MSDGRPRAVRRYLYLLIALTLLAVALVAVGAAPTRRLAGEPVLAEIVAACALGVVASALGALPALLAGGRPGGALALAPTLIRVPVMLLGAAALAIATDLRRDVLLVWVALSYLMFLVVDVIYALKSSPESTEDR